MSFLARQWEAVVLTISMTLKGTTNKMTTYSMTILINIFTPPGAKINSFIKTKKNKRKLRDSFLS